MSVMVDDKPLAAEQMGLMTVGQVLSHIQQTERRLVVHMLIDGREPELEKLSVVRASPLAGHTLYVETAEPRQMALEILQDIESHLSGTDQMRDECVELLRANITVKALEKLRGCFSAWHHAQESVIKTAQLLRIDLARIIVDGRPFTQVLKSFADQLRLIKSSLENRDYVSLIDTLVYEAADTSANWRSAIRSMRSVIQA